LATLAWLLSLLAGLLILPALLLATLLAALILLAALVLTALLAALVLAALVWIIHGNTSWGFWVEPMSTPNGHHKFLRSSGGSLLRRSDFSRRRRHGLSRQASQDS
jgi:fatty acid desaturase